MYTHNFIIVLSLFKANIILCFYRKTAFGQTSSSYTRVKKLERGANVEKEYVMCISEYLNVLLIRYNIRRGMHKYFIKRKATISSHVPCLFCQYLNTIRCVYTVQYDNNTRIVYIVPTHNIVLDKKNLSSGVRYFVRYFVWYFPAGRVVV